jgi:hypothetical protein
MNSSWVSPHPIDLLVASLEPTDKLLWTWLARVWRAWRAPLMIVKPETVLAWHRRGFRAW